jgi:hypothetical protein
MSGRKRNCKRLESFLSKQPTEKRLEDDNEKGKFQFIDDNVYRSMHNYIIALILL